MRAAARPLAVLAALAGVVALAGCSGAVVDADADAAACYPPLACGAFYPVPYYPYAAHPYIGYLHDPAHVIITGAGSRTTVVYRPYSPPLRPAFVTPPRAAPAAPPAKSSTTSKTTTTKTTTTTVKAPSAPRVAARSK